MKRGSEEDAPPPAKKPRILKHALSCSQNCHLEPTMAASPRVFEFMAANPGVSPCTVPISLDGRLFAWKCDKCAHRFHMSCAHVQRGYWCPFCTRAALCGSETCQLCFDKSLASHHRLVSFLAANRSLNLLAVSLTSPTPYKWLCFDCEQMFEAPCSAVTAGNVWCPCRKK